MKKQAAALSAFAFLFAMLWATTLPAQGSRIKLTQLEQAPLIGGSRSGMIGLTNAAGDQRYAFYVNVGDTCITYTPTPTGNTTVSIFVQKCSTDSIWYIDWEGRSILLAPFGGAGACDEDWLQISDNSCPDNIRDSIYHYRYASVGARLVFPGAEFLVNDSLSSAISVVQGFRNARLALYDGNSGTFTMFDHGGADPLIYIPVNGDLTVKTTAGTPQAPVGSQVNHFAVNASDSTIQAHRYPNTRVDTNTVVNFLYTDGVGKFRSKPVAAFPVDVPTIYTADGTISEPRTVTVNGASGGSIGFDLASTGSFNISDLGAGLSSFAVDAGNIGLFDQSTNGLEFTGASSAMYSVSGPFLFVDNRGAGLERGIQYASNYGTDFTGTSLIHKQFAEDLIDAALIGVGTVTSVGLSLPSIFSVSGSPVTTAGTLTGTLATQSANTIFAGPTSGGAVAPTFRALVAADIPAGAGGFFKDGGNSFGATATLGTNDANTLEFETNGATRASLTTGGLFTVTDESSTTNTVVIRENLNTNTTGTPAIGLGTAITLSAETSTTTNTEQARLYSEWSVLSPHSNRTSTFGITVQGLGIASTGLVVRGQAGGGSRVGITQTNPAHLLSNTSTTVTDGTAVSSSGIGWSTSGTPNWTAGFANLSSASTANVLMLRTDATDNSTFLLGASTGTTRLFSVTALGRVGIGDSSPETLLDVAGTAGVVRLIGQDNTPTITVDAAGAGTGATASMTNAQSSDLAGRFSITSGTGATTGRWATITFGAAYATIPTVTLECEDADCANVAVGWYVNVSTTTFEIFATGTPVSSTSHDFAYHVIGGK